MTEVFGPNTDQRSNIPTLGEIRNWFRQVRDIDLAQLEHRFTAAIERNLAGGTSERDGYPSGRPGSGGMDAGTSTESASLAAYHVDGDIEDGDGHWLTPTEAADVVEANLIAAGDHLHTIVAALNAIARRMDRDRDLATWKPTYDPSGSCKACDRWVPGTSVDRLRAGYCDTDYRAWDRAGRPDRTTFEQQRRDRANQRASA